MGCSCHLTKGPETPKSMKSACGPKAPKSIKSPCYNQNQRCSIMEIITPIEKSYKISKIKETPLNIKKKELEEMVDFSDIKKGDIYVNFIQYDKNMKNNENFEYYRYFSVKIMGDYASFDDFNMLKLFISKTNQIPESPPYILMTSGSESVDALNEFHNISFITDIIIFCYEKKKYLYLK